MFLQLENVAKEEEGIVVGLNTSFSLVIVRGLVKASTIVGYMISSTIGDLSWRIN